MSVPDIYAVRGRGLIEETLEDALRGRGAPHHLREWFEIVQQSSTMANVLPMYDRWFRLQHYWRLLHRRYPAALRRKKRALIEVFACFLDVSIDTLKADLRRITGRLGAGWEQRLDPTPSPSGSRERVGVLASTSTLLLLAVRVRWVPVLTPGTT